MKHCISYLIGLFILLASLGATGTVQAVPIGQINISLGPWGGGPPPYIDTGYFNIGYAIDPMLGLDPTTILFEHITLTNADASKTYTLAGPADDPQFNNFVAWMTNGVNNGMGAEFWSGSGVGQNSIESSWLLVYDHLGGNVDLQGYIIDSISLHIEAIATSLTAPNNYPYLQGTILIDGHKPVPEPATNVQASDGTYTDKVQITWTASSGATSYEVWRNTVNDPGTAAQISPSVSGTLYDDTAAFPGTTYYYWVLAIDSYGTESNFSAPDTGYPKGVIPTIVRTTPSGGNFNVPINTTISIQFSASMDTSKGSVQLSDEYSNEIAGTVQWSATSLSNDTLVFTPEHALRPATQYGVHVWALSAQGVSLNGNNKGFDFHFITKPSTADTTPPVVQTVYPYKDMTGVPTTTEVLIRFSEAMNPASINSSPTINNIILSGDGIGGPSDYSVFYDFIQGFVHIKKNTPLSPFSEYTVTVTPNVRDLRGNWLKEQYQWKFTTGAADTISPTVIQTIPADGVTKVSPNAYIHIVFSEEMDQSTLNTYYLYNPDNIMVHDDTHGGDFPFNPYSSKDSVTLLPMIINQGLNLLQNGDHYTVTIGSGVKDLAGNSVTPHSFSFTVAGATNDSTPVLLQGIAPDSQRGERYSDGSSRLKLELSASDDNTSSLTVTAVTPPPPLPPLYNWPFTLLSGWYSYESTRDEGLSSGSHTLAFTIKDGATPQNQITFQRDIYIFESTPILSSPTDQASGVSTTPAFQWSYNGTDRPFVHTVAVFDGPDPKTARVVWQDFAYDKGAVTYSLSIPADKPLASNTTYYWSVWAETKEGNGVTYSAMSSFTTGGTPPPEPRFQRVIVRSDDRLPPTGLRWNLIASLLGPSPADIVDLKVTGPAGSGFQYIFTEDDILQGEQLGLYFFHPLSTRPPDGNYTFTATDSQGRTATQTFNFINPSAPIPRVDSSTMHPADNCGDNCYVNTATPTFSWTGVGSGYYYRVVVMDWNSKTDAVYYSDFTQDTHITIPSGYLLSKTPYRWRVDVYDTPWNNRSASATLRFSTGSSSYTLDIPSAYVWSDNNYYNAFTKLLGAVVTGPLPNEVTQMNVAGPDGYNHNFAEFEIQFDLVTEGIQYGYGGGGFPADGTYTFTVQDKYAATATFSKDQTSAAIPIVDQGSLSPANNAYIDNLTPTLTWTGVGSNLYYRVKINDWMGRYTVFNSLRSTDCSVTIPSGFLKPNRSYKWRVEVFDNSDGPQADNRSSSAWNSFTTFDAATIPPIGSIVINNNAAFTSTTAVTLTLSASDANGVSEMCVSNSSTLPCPPWESYATTKSWTLSAGDGTKNVYVWFKDGLNNANTIPYSDSIILDTTAPVVSSFSAGSGNAQVALTWSGFDATSGIGNYTLVYSIAGIPNSCSDGIQIYSGSSTSYTHPGLTNGTIYYYRACAADHAGNTSLGLTVSATPTSSNTPPLPPTNVMASDGFFADWVQVTWLSSSGATSYEVWCNTVNDPVSAIPIASSVTGTMYNDTTGVAGIKYYYWVKAKNPFGTSGVSAPDTGYRGAVPSGNLLTVTKMGTGGGMITSSLPGINCGTDCSEFYDPETSVTLTPNPDNTSRFTGWSGYDSISGNQCTVNMASNRTVTASFVYRRLENLDIAVYNGSLSGFFSVFPGFRDLLQSATLTGPGVSYGYNLQNDTQRWLSECRYLDGWTKSFSSFGYGEYTLTLTFYDGVTETYTKNLQSKTLTVVDAQSITVNILSDGSANVAWSPPLAGQYYGVRVRRADGSVEYFRSPAQLDANSLFIPAQALNCLVRGQNYRWLVRAYNAPEMSYEGASTYQAVATSYIVSPYNPSLPGQRTTSYMATDWDGKLMLGFDVRPGSRGEVTQATVTGPNNFTYQFDLSADKLDLSTPTRTNKLWWKHFNPPFEYGDYTFQIVFSDAQTDTLTKTLIPVPITPVTTGMAATIQPNGAIGFNWVLPSPPPVVNQSYEVRIRSLDGTKEYYSSPRLVNGNMVFTSYWELRGLEPCKAYQWFVRAYDQFNNTMRQSASQIFFYNPLNVSCLDTIPPTGSVLINSDAPYTNSTSVNLTLSAADPAGASQMCISNTPSCSSWESYAPSRSWTLSSGDEAKTAYAWFMDFIGNANSLPYSDSIILDTTPPVVSDFSAVPGNGQVALTWISTDAASGVASYKLVYSTVGPPDTCSEDGTRIYRIYSGSNTFFTHAGLPNWMTYYYRLCATDKVGNTSSGVTASARPPTASNSPPLPPTNVQASEGFFVGGIQVTWTGSFGAMWYDVWRNTVNDPGTAVQIASSVMGTMYNDGGVASGIKYYYWVTATNPYGTSNFSTPDTGYLAGALLPDYLLTVTRAGTGGGMITSSLVGINCGADCSEIYDAGTSVTLTASPDSTSKFASWTGCDSVFGNQCVVDNLASDRTVTANFAYRRLDILDIAVYNGNLGGFFTVFPGFKDLLRSAILTGPDGFSHQYDLQNDTLRWLSECRYLDGWTKSFSSFGYGEYTLTLTFYDGVTETYTKNLESKTVTPVDTQTITVTILSDGSANAAWSPPLTGQYYGVRVRSADGSVEYFRSPAQLNASSLMIPAQSLGCLVRGQSYRWLVRAYDSPEMGYEGASTYHAVATSYIELPYNPLLPGQRTNTYMATDWDGKLMLGFDVRPGSRVDVTQATVTGENGFSYQFDLSADKIDLSMATRTNKLWWKHLDPPLVYGNYIFQIVFSDTHTETLTKTLNKVDITPVDAGTMSSMIQLNGGIGFNWAPQGVNQSYEVRIRSLDGTKEYYGSPRLFNRNMVVASFWELRGLEHCKSYQWFVRAYDQFNNTMRQSSSKEFFYNPFDIVNTPAGNNVIAAAGDGTKIEFANVKTAGITQVAVTSEGPSPPTGFSLGNQGEPPTYYNVTTEAEYTKSITICISYDPARYSDPNDLHLFHSQNGNWVEVLPVTNDAINHKICGQVNSLSPFIIAETATPITVNRALDPLPNAQGWNNTNVTVTFTATDEVSPASCMPPSVTLGNEGPSQTVTTSCSDELQNRANGSATVKIDKTAPTLTSSISPAPNAARWNNSNVTVSYTCSDSLSGVLVCPEPNLVSTEGANQLVTATATDKAGNSAPIQTWINVDKTPPILTPSISPAPNAAGWNNSAVTVSYTCSDSLSGVLICPEPNLVSSEGEQLVEATATDKAGNSVKDSRSVKIDKTPPQITITGITNGATYLLGSVPSPGYGRTDNLSGVVTENAILKGGNANGVGTFTYSVNATDKAGNTAAKVVSYTVVYDFVGFKPPIQNPSVVNILNAGRTVPVKWQIPNGKGGFISDLSVVTSIQFQKVACKDYNSGLENPVLAATSGSSGLGYDTTANQYIYNWKTDKSMAGGCYVLILRLNDSSEHRANFSLK
jgi:hypothetical protein